MKDKGTEIMENLVRIWYRQHGQDVEVNVTRKEKAS